MRGVRYSLVCLLMLVVNFMQAEEKDKFPRIEEMHERKFQFLVTQAQLNPQEAAKVKPVFMNYEKALWELSRQNREFFKSAMKNAKNVKPNYAELNDKYVEYEFKQAQLFKSYHSQLRKILQPEDLFNYYRAERQFKRQLLRDFQDHHEPERPRPQ